MFTVGIPLFDEEPTAKEEDQEQEEDVTNILQEERRALLDETDFMEYNVSRIGLVILAISEHI